MNIILDVTGTPHPKACVHGTEPINGVAYFQWLDADENPKGSTGVVARFTPSSTETNGVVTWDEPTEAELITAIEAA